MSPTANDGWPIDRDIGVLVDITPDYAYRGVRSYRVSRRKIQSVLGFSAVVDIEEAVREMVAGIRQYHLEDFDNPRYYNIRWMRLLEEAERAIAVTGSVFGAFWPPCARRSEACVWRICPLKKSEHPSTSMS